MKLNNEKSRSLGSLVKKVNTDGANIAEVVLEDTIKKANVSEVMLTDLLANDFVLAVTPATLGTAIAVANDVETPFTRDVVISIVGADTEVKTYYNAKLPVAVAKTSTAGTVSIGDVTEVELVEGEATITITYGGTWEANDTCTLTVGTDAKVAGIALVAKTSVDTLIS